MTPDEQARWHSAHTLTDLCELTAQFMEGKLTETPTHYGPPDPETAPLLSLLAAVNRAGYMTDMSQPAFAQDSDGSAQRAMVQGFVSTSTLPALIASVAGADLIIVIGRGLSGTDSLGPFTVITLDGGEEFTWAGFAQGPGIVAQDYSDDLCKDAIAALCAAWQVTIIDPQWGRDDQLWPLLQDFATEQTRPARPEPATHESGTPDAT